MSSSVPPGVSAPELRAYLDLVELYDQRGEANMRDRFLILAADAASAAGLTQLAEQLLQRLLQFSPHHMLKAYRSFPEALKAEPVRNYLADLKQNYPPEMVRNLLEVARSGDRPQRSRAPSPTAMPFSQTLPAGGIPAPRSPADDETAILPPPPVARSGDRATTARPAPAQSQARAPPADPFPRQPQPLPALPGPGPPRRRWHRPSSRPSRPPPATRPRTRPVAAGWPPCCFSWSCSPAWPLSATPWPGRF